MVCSAQYLGQATVNPQWFIATNLELRFVVFGRTTTPGFPLMKFDLCIATGPIETPLWTNEIRGGFQIADSGWLTYESVDSFRLNLHGRKTPGTFGQFIHAYVLVREAGN